MTKKINGTENQCFITTSHKMHTKCQKVNTNGDRLLIIISYYEKKKQQKFIVPERGQNSVI